MEGHFGFTLPGKRLHLGVCGSISAYKALELLRLLMKAQVGTSVTLTPGARRFVTDLSFQSLGASKVYGEMFANEEPFAHLEPGQIAHAMLVAPASADAMARLALGRAQDMLSCQALAFGGPLLIAPAMNPRMWANPATQENLAVLKRRGAIIIGPAGGVVACGDEGQGKLAPVENIFLAALKALSPQDMAGQTVLVTLGPTREHFDDVRFWSNGSTGTMGAALAVAAWLRGASVHAVCGPVGLNLPEDEHFCRHNVQSAAHMFTVAEELWPRCTAGIFAAAVADYRPENARAGKFKKNEAPQGFSLPFSSNPDILRTLAVEQRGGQKVMGFAAEAQDLPALARGKLERKKADMLVGNLIGESFGKADNRVFVTDRQGREEFWEAMPKAQVAWKLLDWFKTL